MQDSFGHVLASHVNLLKYSAHVMCVSV